MSSPDPHYNVREQTGDPSHASVNDVVECVLAQSTRNTDSEDQLNEAMADIVDRYGSDTVRTVIHRILVQNHPFRTATADLEMRNIDGIRIGTAAVETLRSLNRDQDE